MVRADLRDRRLARLLQQLQDLPGQEVFQYLDSRGEAQTIASHDVNDYLRDIAGADYSAKDLRTWSGTVLAASALCDLEPADSATARKLRIREAIKAVSAELHNTPAVCRRYYVHPAVLAAYEDGTLCARLRRGRPSRRDRMSAAERAVARLLRE
jgi:DNA topoisomerase I